MEFFLFVLAGFLGGILGGMGMGGGTVLIPLLNIFYGVNQHTAQAVNLVSFIPMSIVAIIIHFKNKLIDFKWVFNIVLPGVIFCVLGCYIARAMSGETLKRIFGGFLIALSVVQLLTELKKFNNSKKQ